MGVSDGTSPGKVAPYFVVVTLIHVAALATRFDVLAARLPAGADLAIMVAQFPLIVLSGFFEGGLDYGRPMPEFPAWMRIRSRPVKLAMTFGFIYLCCVTLQTWHISIGPIDPTPPLAWPTAQRAAWFAMFTAGMFFPFYLAATGLFIPILRVITKPLRYLPRPLGALLALALGGGVGLVVFALVTSTALGAYVAGVHRLFAEQPALGLGLTGGLTFGPMLIGLVVARLRG